MKVRDWMTKDPITITEDTPLLDGFRIFREYDIRHLPVVRDQRLVGILSNRDLGHLLIDRYAGRPFQDMETAGDAMTRKVVKELRDFVNLYYVLFFQKTGQVVAQLQDAV